MPKDQIALLAKIRGEAELGTQPENPTPSALPLSAIKQEPDFFQPRNIDQLESKRHIDSLVTGIRNDEEGTLEPVTVWWSGKRWLLIDGHHRLAAYKKAYAGKKMPLIPVSVTRGNWKEAYLESMRGNGRDKLPVRREDKFNRAWRMLVLDMGSIASIYRTCGIAERTVYNMRDALQRIKEQRPETWTTFCLDRNWRAIQKGMTEAQKYDDDYTERLAEDFRRRLGKEFGNKLYLQPEATARALELYSPVLVRSLVDIWSSHIGEEDV